MKIRTALFNLIVRLRMKLDPVMEFEKLDKLNVTFRVQNMAISLAQTTDKYINDIVSELIDCKYLYK